MTGLVYLAIIALWAVFLIPWLSRHRDDQNGRRRAEHFHRAMDTLARGGENRRSAADQDDQQDGAADEDVTTGPTMPTMAQVAGMASGALGSRGGTPSGAVRRRRRVLGLLGVVFAASLAASLAGVVPGVAPAAAGALLVAYVTVLLRTASRNGFAVDGAGRGDGSDRFRDEAKRAQRQARSLLTKGQAKGAEASKGWDAVPTTLPTYVSKPRASKVPRVVDLTAPARGWAGDAMVQRAQEERRQGGAAAQQQFDREIAFVEPDDMAEVADLANPAESAESYNQPYRPAANG